VAKEGGAGGDQSRWGWIVQWRGSNGGGAQTRVSRRLAIRQVSLAAMRPHEATSSSDEETKLCYSSDTTYLAPASRPRPRQAAVRYQGRVPPRASARVERVWCRGKVQGCRELRHSQVITWISFPAGASGDEYKCSVKLYCTSSTVMSSTNLVRRRASSNLERRFSLMSSSASDRLSSRMPVFRVQGSGIRD